MNKTAVVLIAFGGGIAGSIASGILFPASPPAESPRTAAPKLASAATLTGDEQRMREMEAEIASLRVLMNTMERRFSERSEVRPEQQSLGSIASQPKTYSGTDIDAMAAADTVLDARIEQVLEDREAKDRADRRLRQAQQREEALTARIGRYAEQLQLDDYQTGEMKRVLGFADEKRFGLFDEMRESGAWDRDAIRTATEEIQNMVMTDLELVLTPTQLEQYTEIRSNERNWFGRGNNRRGSGNSGGGDGGGNRRGGGF